jgi:hypothetical protein
MLLLVRLHTYGTGDHLVFEPALHMHVMLAYANYVFSHTEQDAALHGLRVLLHHSGARPSPLPACLSGLLPPMLCLVCRARCGIVVPQPCTATHTRGYLGFQPVLRMHVMHKAYACLCKLRVHTRVLWSLSRVLTHDMC